MREVYKGSIKEVGLYYKGSILTLFICALTVLPNDIYIYIKIEQTF